MTKYLVMAYSANGAAYEDVICAPGQALPLDAARIACLAEQRAGRRAYIVGSDGECQSPDGRWVAPGNPFAARMRQRITEALSA